MRWEEPESQRFLGFMMAAFSAKVAPRFGSVAKQYITRLGCKSPEKTRWEGAAIILSFSEYQNHGYSYSSKYSN